MRQDSESRSVNDVVGPKNKVVEIGILYSTLFFFSAYTLKQEQVSS